MFPTLLIRITISASYEQPIRKFILSKWVQLILCKLYRVLRISQRQTKRQNGLHNEKRSIEKLVTKQGTRKSSIQNANSISACD